MQVYIIEANPRASRTVPFVAKAIGHPIAKYASLLMSGQTLPEIGFTQEPELQHVAVKEAVLPFDKFPGLSRCFRVVIPCRPETKPKGTFLYSPAAARDTVNQLLFLDISTSCESSQNSSYRSFSESLVCARYACTSSD